MKQFAIIGLGNFGCYLAIHLYEKGHEVLAIDKNPKPVQEIKDRVSQAILQTQRIERFWSHWGLKKLILYIVCIGSILSNSILATLNLKDIGVNRVLAMALKRGPWPHSRKSRGLRGLFS